MPAIRVFLAGASGAIGRRLVPALIAAGHDDNERAKSVMGWTPVHATWRPGFRDP